MDKKNLVFQAQVFKEDLSTVIGELDYSLESLAKVEKYISETVPIEGKPNKNSFFSSETSDKVFALGCYTGEVIRRLLSTVVWYIDADSDSPLSISLTNSVGAIGFVINKAYKRIYEGDGDDLLHFAKVLTTDLLREDVETTSHFDDEDHNIAEFGNSKACFISNEVYNGDLDVDDANYSEGNWIFTNQGESIGADNRDAFTFIFLDEVKVRYPKLFSEIDKRTNEERLRIVKENDGSYRFQKAHKDLFFDSSSMASFQGNMKLNPIQWIKMNTAKVFRVTLYLILSFYAMIKIHWIFAIVFVGCLLYNLWYWFGVKSRFGGGNVSPGKVISVSPDKIAVATDLSKMIGNYPVVKILKTKLVKEDKKVGKFIPTVAIYNENPHGYPFWAEFHPVPVSHGVTDRDHWRHLLSKFKKEDFEEIDNYLTQIGTSKIGTYKVDVETSEWKNFTHVDINKGINLEGPISDKES